MEIQLKDNTCIITPLSPKLNKHEAERLFDEIDHQREKVGLDLSIVQDCTIDFIEKLKMHKELSLFNINSDIFALLIKMNLDKELNIFASELDFCENKHKLLSRKFCIVS